MTRRIDLNADIGESESEDEMLRDEALMAAVSSVNIACGGHAGDAASIDRMVAAAKVQGCAIGAHPSYPDRKGFGRQPLDIAPEDLAHSLIEQVRAVDVAVRKLDARLAHIKPHGALYNRMADDGKLAGYLSARLAEHWPKVAQVGLAGGAAQANVAPGVPYIAEGFIDRRYDTRGRLVARGLPGAMVDTEAERTAQALSIAAGRPVKDINGRDVTVHADSLCIHSDSPGALEATRALSRALKAAGFTIAAPDQ